MDDLRIDGMLPTERIAVVVWGLAQGKSYTTTEIMEATGLTRFGAYKLACRISRVIPLYQDGKHWRVLDGHGL